MVSNRFYQSPGFVDLQHRRPASPLRVLRPANGVSGIEGKDLADHHPVEQHPQSGKPDLHRGLGLGLQLQFDEGRDMDRLDLGEVQDAVIGTEGGELADRLHVGTASIRIADMRAEEVAHPRAGFRKIGKDRGKGSAAQVGQT